MNNFDLYIVNPGDTLYNIAKKYQISSFDLMQKNGMTNTLLRVGQQLIVPGNGNNVTYYVEDGDTLSSIANKFNIDIDELKKENNLNTDDVIIGQILNITKKRS